ncbi:uncharacterized protein K444DRAFT_628688 [Hyaloscypha bicolor E]|uniref:DUF7918 domain-containing protein n=1 Tax=Hyaloscypha bicolor E TaxID=1095630 RepID=A0A2J6TF81_9HELO|nr:uncharacterized protein K444DRAFT_628688 [Hyaloscypha bicolor E]PMD61670.1 hypothetical protein K444DRAFT_628688 [Hyaloscypha bicolor E]
MAILDSIPGLEVFVCVDDKPLAEYDDDDDGEGEVEHTQVAEYQAARTVSKFVESVSDKEFSIRLNLETSFVMDCASLIFPINIDGKPCWEPVLAKSRFPQSVQGSRVLSRVTINAQGVRAVAPGIEEQEFLQKFKFSKIDTTMDDDKLATVQEDMKRIQEVGEIIVKVYKGGEIKDTTRSSTTNNIDLHSVGDKVHEKALKGDPKSHSASLGPATELVKKSYVACQKVDGVDYPIAIFKFKYRSRDALKSLLIIERTPSPEPAEAPVPEPALSLDNLNPAQKTRLEQFLRELVNDGGAGRNSPNRTIKREHGEENRGGEGSRKKRKSGPPVTIDLTDD